LSINNRIDRLAEKHHLDELTGNFERFVQNAIKNAGISNKAIDNVTEKITIQTESVKTMENKVKEIEFRNQNIVLKDELITMYEKIDSKADQIDIRNI